MIIVKSLPNLKQSYTRFNVANIYVAIIKIKRTIPLNQLKIFLPLLINFIFISRLLRARLRFAQASIQFHNPTNSYLFQIRISSTRCRSTVPITWFNHRSSFFPRFFPS